MTSYIAKTIEGLEEVTAKEIHGEIILPQTILCKKLPKDPRTVSVMYKLLKRGTFSGMADMIHQAMAAKKKLRKKEAYKVAYSRKGRHDFKGMDIVKEMGIGLRNCGYVINYEKAKKTIYMDIIDNEYSVGILIKDNLCKRPYRVRYNNKSISGCIAAAVIMMAGVKKNESLLDPWCKDAVIPLEAHELGIRDVHAMDPVKNNIRNAVINCKFAKTKIVPKCYDITWLDTLFKKESIDHVVTNMLLSKHDKEPEKGVKEFFHQANFIVKQAVTIITNKPEIIKKNSSSWVLIKEWKISVGDMHYSVLKFGKSASP